MSCFVGLENVCSLELFLDNFFSFGKLGSPPVFTNLDVLGHKPTVDTILPTGTPGHVQYFSILCPLVGQNPSLLI